MLTTSLGPVLFPADTQEIIVGCFDKQALLDLEAALLGAKCRQVADVSQPEVGILAPQHGVESHVGLGRNDPVNSPRAVEKKKAVWRELARGAFYDTPEDGLGADVNWSLTWSTW